MAPEQYQGIISKEGDQYALGRIAYELLTGRVSFVAPTLPMLLAMHMAATPQAPSTLNTMLSAEAELAILKALSKQREDRYVSILASSTALTTPGTAVSTSATPDPLMASQAGGENEGTMAPGRTFFASRPP
jgi:serine/threonine protein kinase